MKLLLKNRKYMILFAVIALVVSCVEEIPLESSGFEEAIVIEATITNEVKQQQIKLFQAFAIDTTGPNPLSGATVKVIGNSEYLFEEDESGIYKSRDSFAAQPGINYQLNILANGKEYESELMELLGTNIIDQLEANRIDYRGENGVAITLNNQTSNGTANYYKYEYVETFKFNSNYFKVNDIILIDGLPVEVPKQKEEYTCYRTTNSQEIILANTNSLSENSVNDLLIKFIESSNPGVSNRYSLLVKQFIISREAYTYYEILKELSSSDNLFSQSQPGFFAGNISNINNPDEKVIGFFNVSSVSEKRIFFNYEDFYEPESIRPRFVPFAACEAIAPSIPTLIVQLEQDAVRWSETTPGGVLLVVPKRCVDCTVFGTNVKPEFWVD
ncbi:DUF4249 domain-containing protein [Gillisia sp. CAL575]|uniref:DUF4249 domain-containing protein n=1 Tax=Gillisia sp. CAL575 TaxID=985255 RepID=UPI000556EDA9|nr:DUF4249 domain-containing protein [Gillisia sp. CAL575]